MGFDVRTYLQVFRSRRIAVMLLFGFSSGMPLALTGSTLQAWLTNTGVDLKTIGIFSLLGLPYTIKFIWSPVMDRFVLPWLGRRRGWIIATQVMLMVFVSLMAVTSPVDALPALAVLALLVAFASATQDIAVDAYRTDVLQEEERGVGAAVFIAGYRLAMLVSGALALVLSDSIGWRDTYLSMAGFMLIGIAASFMAKEAGAGIAAPKTLREAVAGPLRDFFSRKGAYMFLLLIILYKLCDAYAGSMTTAFLIRGIGFSNSEVGTVNKTIGLITTIIGGLFGGGLMIKLGLFRSLLVFGILQGISNLAFMALALIGKSYPALFFTVTVENFTGGMGTSAFVSLLMVLCSSRFSATQYALLSSLAALGRVVVAPTSGFLAEAAGWASFFFITSLSSLPGLLLLVFLRKGISELKKN